MTQSGTGGVLVTVVSDTVDEVPVNDTVKGASSSDADHSIECADSHSGVHAIHAVGRSVGVSKAY